MQLAMSPFCNITALKIIDIDIDQPLRATESGRVCMGHSHVAIGHFLGRQ